MYLYLYFTYVLYIKCGTVLFFYSQYIVFEFKLPVFEFHSAFRTKILPLSSGKATVSLSQRQQCLTEQRGVINCLFKMVLTITLISYY